MLIMGIDYHPSFQQIAFLDQETGGYDERRLNHSDGEAERFAAVAGRSDKSNGPLNRQMINVTPYGSRYRIPLCPEAARNFGIGASTGFIHSLS
jgi:hypothetical protein